MFSGRGLIIGFALCTGCADQLPPPVGPKVIGADLRPWLAAAPTVEFTGLVENFYVESRWGTYLTWSLHPAGPHEGCELDVRGCAAEAVKLNNRLVTVRGQLIERGPVHLPLLVAKSIEAHALSASSLAPASAR